MGLDMFLNAEMRYSLFHEKHKREAILDIIGLPWVPELGITLKVVMHHWRNANAVHSWFTRSMGQEIKCCVTIDVSRVQLAQLKENCLAVLDSAVMRPGRIHISTTFSSEGQRENWIDGEIISDTTVAEKLLPVAPEYPGGAQYSSLYVRQLRETVDALHIMLSDESLVDAEFSYQASW